MAVYRCFECDTFRDGDWHPCEVHPTNSGELICDDCLVEFDVVPISPDREAMMNKLIKEAERDCSETD